MALSFADIASKKAEDIERPPLPPVGTYHWRIVKLPVSQKSADEKWEFLRFNCKVVQPMDNVDASDYKGDVNNVVLSKSFVFNCEDEAEFDKTLFNVRQFLENHVGCFEEGMTISQALNASINGEFLGDVKWSQDKRDESGETMNAEIGRSAPVE